MPVLVGAAQRLPCRLLAARVPQEGADQQRRRLHETARRKGRAVSPVRLALCGWAVLLTNVPPDRLTLREARGVARARWRIELLFTLWKRESQLDQWRTANP